MTATFQHEHSQRREVPRKPRLLSVREAAEYLTLSVSTLYGWVYQRRISFIKVGRALRFDIADLDRFIEANRVREKSGSKTDRDCVEYARGWRRVEKRAANGHLQKRAKVLD